MSLFHLRRLFYPCMISKHNTLVIWKTLVHWVIQSFNTFYYIKYFKNHICSYHHWVHQKILEVLGNSQACRETQTLRKKLGFFLLKNLSFVISSTWYQLFFLNWDSLCSFLEKCLQNTFVSITIVCQSFCQAKMVLHEKCN